MEKCGGVDCTFKAGYYQTSIIYKCPINNCLICLENELIFLSECDNSVECSMIEGCLNCIKNDECKVCKQGYYLLGGFCHKCIEGCSICSNNQTCDYCMSGYDLDSNKECFFTNNFDFNISEYNIIKKKLIQRNYPNELPPTNDNPLIRCDLNCEYCNNRYGECIKCKQSYSLKNNYCIKCKDEYCENCGNNINICTKCQDGKKLFEGKCALDSTSCSDYFQNCNYCFTSDKCVECINGYELDDKGNCKKKSNYYSLVLTILIILLIFTGIISICIYKKRKNALRIELTRGKV